MSKNLTTDNFNDEVEKFHDKLISYVRGSIFDFKRTHGLSDSEISEIFNIDEDTLSDFMHEDWDGYVDSRFLSILYLLNNGDFDFSKVFYKKPSNLNEIISSYVNSFSVNRHEKNINELFELLGIEDDDDLEMAVVAIKEILKNKCNG